MATITDLSDAEVAALCDIEGYEETVSDPYALGDEPARIPNPESRLDFATRVVATFISQNVTAHADRQRRAT